MSLSLRCDTAIAEIKEMQIHMEIHYVQFKFKVKVYQWEYFGIDYST